MATIQPRLPLPGEIRPLTADEIRQAADHDWCLSNCDVLQQYAGQIVAVHGRQVWGHGPNHEAAVRSAQQALLPLAGREGTPAPDELVYVVLPSVAQEPPIPAY